MKNRLFIFIFFSFLLIYTKCIYSYGAISVFAYPEDTKVYKDDKTKINIRVDILSRNLVKYLHMGKKFQQDFEILSKKIKNKRSRSGNSYLIEFKVKVKKNYSDHKYGPYQIFFFQVHNAMKFDRKTNVFKLEVESEDGSSDDDYYSGDIRDIKDNLVLVYKPDYSLYYCVLGFILLLILILYIINRYILKKFEEKPIEEVEEEVFEVIAKDESIIVSILKILNENAGKQQYEVFILINNSIKKHFSNYYKVKIDSYTNFEVKQFLRVKNYNDYDLISKILDICTFVIYGKETTDLNDFKNYLIKSGR